MPPRRSTRKAATTAVPPTASVAADKDDESTNTPPVSKSTPKAPVSKGKPRSTKRTRDDQDDVDNKRPVSKKARKADGDADNTDATPSAKTVTVLKRGAAPVDPTASPYITTHQVYVSPDGQVWDAMLNQTNIGKNANKFYVLQLLHPMGNSSSCILFLRWGRTGENGANQVKGPWPAPMAINEFKKQFRSKTATAWENRQGMLPKTGKYVWLERDFESDEQDKEEEDKQQQKAPQSKGKKKEELEPEKVPDSTLHPEIQALCKLIFSTQFIDAALSSMNYDANKLPLGKLSKATILRGFAALKELSEVLETPSKATQYGGLLSACEQLSSSYYSIIPHAFGRSKPITISSMPQLKKELELVDALGDMEIAQKLISSGVRKDENGNPMNPLDAHFRSLDLESMTPVASDSMEFSALSAYARDTHGSTHSYYKTAVHAAFRVRRKYEDDNWKKGGFDGLGPGQRLLLWHGSRSTNFAGILTQGLRIAPPEAPVNGYMFGKGVYFADMMSKSYNYCYAGMSDNIGILLLCEVAAKPCYELTDANSNAAAECKNDGKLATRGIGRTQPVDWQDAGEALNHDELRGCLMPKGAAQDVNPPGAYLQYNEYIVYDTSQIKVKYLLMVKTL